MERGFRPHLGTHESLLLLQKDILKREFIAIHVWSLRSTSKMLFILSYTSQLSTVLNIEDLEAELYSPWRPFCGTDTT